MRPEALRQEAEALRQQGRQREALARLEDLVRLAPDAAGGWFAYGRALSGARRDGEAITALQRACELDPTDTAARTALGGLYENHSLVEEAIHWHGQALALAPDSLVLRLNHAFVWPVVADSVAQIRRCRERCREAFERTITDPAVSLQPEHVAINHTFGLTYHGSNDRELLEAYGRLVSRHVGQGAPQPPGDLLSPRPRTDPRLRLGFVSAYFYDHSNSRAFEGLLRGIDRQRFAIVLIHLDGSRADAVRERLEGLADAVLHCPSDIAATWQQLWALDLDLLFITDVGMNPAVPALLARRCAAVQVTGWGYPCTSGFANLDYYLSGDLVEPPDGQEHYSETLVRLSGLPCRYLSQDLQLDRQAAAMGRSYFFLPEELPLVGCLQTFWKLHPDFDAVLEAIARAVPEVLFVFLEPPTASLAGRFRQRLRHSAPTACERVLMLSGVKRAEYAVLAGCLDLLLDTLHFGAGISFYESIHSGTPIVTVQGPMLRSRYVAGGYRLMGLEEAPVVDSAAALAERSIALLRDPQARQRLRQRIQEAAGRHLYDRLDLVHSFEDFALEAIGRARSQAGRG